MKKSLLLVLTILMITVFSLVNCKAEATEEVIEEAVVEELEEEPEFKEESLVAEKPEEEPKKEFSPIIIGNISSYIGFAANVHVAEDYAYIAGGGLNIIDVTDKKNPIMVGMNCSSAWWRVGFCVEGNFAYSPYETLSDKGSFSGGGLQIIDISDKNSPTVVGTFESEGRIKDVWVMKDYAYATYEKIKQFPEVEKSGIHIIDFSDKENPKIAGVYETNNFGISSIRIEGDYIYVIVGDNLKILDIKDRENPVDKSNYPVSGTMNFYMKPGTIDFYIGGNYLYIPSVNSLQIIDISNKENPIIVGDIAASGEVTDVFINGSYAYITYVIRNSENQIEESGMQIIDVEDKSNPALVAELEIPGEAMGIFVEGDYAYVGALGAGLHIIKLFNE